jgi:hypothetical protein
MSAKESVKLLVCTESFATSIDGRTVIVGMGQEMASDQPAVLVSPERFAEVPVQKAA